MARRKLTFDQVEALYDATLSNAYYLGRDAELLLDHGSVGRAQALGVLALEEAAKAIMIHEAKRDSFLAGLREPQLTDQFWADWNHHHPKLRAVRRFLLAEEYWFGVKPPTNDLLLGQIEDYFEDLDQFAAEGNASKLRGLYVDVDRATGRPVLPSEEKIDEALQLIAWADQIGEQLRLGDHIVFVAATRNMGNLDQDNPFTAAALDQSSKLGTLGWESATDSVRRLMQHLDAQAADRRDDA